jgi:hypothetical protein
LELLVVSEAVLLLVVALVVVVILVVIVILVGAVKVELMQGTEKWNLRSQSSHSSCYSRQ